MFIVQMGAKCSRGLLFEVFEAGLIGFLLGLMRVSV